MLTNMINNVDNMHTMVTGMSALLNPMHTVAGIAHGRFGSQSPSRSKSGEEILDEDTHDAEEVSSESVSMTLFYISVSVSLFLFLSLCAPNPSLYIDMCMCCWHILYRVMTSN